MPYYYVQHTCRKGFVTHEDNEANHVSNYHGDVWITSGSAWAARVGATEETKAQAQARTDAAIGAANAELSSSAGWSNDTQPTSSYITLP